MPEFSVREISKDSEVDRTRWKLLVKTAEGGTIFHDPDFLAYHGSRFDEHHLGVFKGQELFGVMPLAILKEGTDSVAKSPYGASYGGLICSKALGYSSSRDVVRLLLDYLPGLGVSKVVMTPPISIHFERPNDTLMFAFMERGFRVVNSDITSVLDLTGDPEGMITPRAKRMVAKAAKNRVEVEDNADMDVFWGLMEKTYDKLKTRPTHLLPELKHLNSTFPEDIYADIALVDGVPSSGLCIFNVNRRVQLSFYICNDPGYNDTQSLSYLISKTVQSAKRGGFSFFDFGTSSVNMVARENIFVFKEGFGTVGRFRRTYSLGL